MKKFWILGAILTVAVVLVLVGAVTAADQEKTLTGTLACGKCTLKDKDGKPLASECTNVLQVKEGDKTVNYFLQDDGKGADYHKGICPGGKTAEVTVTGVVSEKDGKNYIKPSKVTPK